MKKIFTLLATLLILSACSSGQPEIDQAEDQELQIGVNFIRFFYDNSADVNSSDLNFITPYYQPDWIFEDFEDLGVQAMRQFVKADLLWDKVEPEDDEWTFEAADKVIPNTDYEPIVTLFAMQYASPTPPWAETQEEFQKELGPEAEDYLETIIDRYGPYVKYWEIGNEMEHWRSYDPGDDSGKDTSMWRGEVYPAEGYSPQEQGLFLRQAAEFIKEHDDDAVIVMPGLGGIDEYAMNNWFAGVLEGAGGTDWFDIVNYHFYPEWGTYARLRQNFQDFLSENEIEDKPVWLTETGSTSSTTLTDKTDYPNNKETQAADVFRRIIQAYGAGDSFVMWHSYIGGSNTPNNDWRLFGLREENSSPAPAMETFKLLTSELIPFSEVEKISTQLSGKEANNVYRITTKSGEIKYVAWGDYKYQIPEEVSQMTSVYSQSQSHKWIPVFSGDEIQLTETPILLK